MVPDTFACSLFLVPWPPVTLNVSGDSCEVDNPLGTKFFVAGVPVHLLKLLLESQLRRILKTSSNAAVAKMEPMCSRDC